MRGKHTRLGAYGEKAVEAELLRHGWLPSNINASVKNAADFDIVALKDERMIKLRVKTCSSNMNAFQFGGFQPGRKITFKDVDSTDFTVLVRMGTAREDDLFYVIPTRVLRAQVSGHRRRYLNVRTRSGQLRKDTGYWTLHLQPMKRDKKRYSHNFTQKWATYLNNWHLLEE
jgi:hypothetical protein